MRQKDFMEMEFQVTASQIWGRDARMNFEGRELASELTPHVVGDPDQAAELLAFYALREEALERECATLEDASKTTERTFLERLVAWDKRYPKGVVHSAANGGPEKPLDDLIAEVRAYLAPSPAPKQEPS